jgi:hypothetical protein
MQWCWHMHPWPSDDIKRLQCLLLYMLNAYNTPLCCYSI